MHSIVPSPSPLCTGLHSESWYIRNVVHMRHGQVLLLKQPMSQSLEAFLHAGNCNCCSLVSLLHSAT
eukprot:1141292-Pelagomonas_calceolata.AAC.2